MGHTLEAFIARQDPLREAVAGFRYARLIPLRAGLALLPVTDDFHDEVATAYRGGTEERLSEFWRLSPSLAVLGHGISQHTPVAYVETDYFGGVGTQAAIAWDRGRIVFGPSKDEEWGSADQRPINQALHALGVRLVRGKPINRALRWLGVRTWWPIDAFAAVGLDRFRSNEDWIESRSE